MKARGVAALLMLAGVAGTACGASEDVVYQASEVRTPTTPPPTTTTSTTTTLPTTSTPATTIPQTPIVIERLWSPANALAELTGTGATTDDPITVDGESATVVSFDSEDDGSFTATVRIDEEGAHTVCVREECERVYVLDADAETIEQAEEKISEAIPLAKEQFDFETEFPDWSIETAGPLSGTGGSTDAENRAVIIYANRNRELDEFVTTILHEWGHAIDAERLTDEERAQYRVLRGIDPETPWRSQEAHSIEEWGLQPSEDFAEVMVALWTDGKIVPRTSQIAPAPDADTLAAVALLVER
ncbi:MAG: hypothetical protein IZT58_07945 [Actinobacteria bacterium]|nr:hypothetical protein [Actinomycetota bacterium]